VLGIVASWFIQTGPQKSTNSEAMPASEPAAIQ